MFRLLTVFISILLTSISAHAADMSVIIYGTVTDSTGKTVPGTDVMFISGSDTVSAITDAEGRYDLVLSDMTTGIQESAAPVPFALSQNYPNPFNPTTTIPFILNSPSPVRLDIFSITGQHVRTLINGYLGTGVHTIVWDGVDEAGNGVSAGVYFYRLRAGSQESSRKMLLLDGNSDMTKHTTGNASLATLKSADTATGQTYSIIARKSTMINYQNNIDIFFNNPELEWNIVFPQEYIPYRLFFESSGIRDMFVLSGDTLGVTLAGYHEMVPTGETITLRTQTGDIETVVLSGNGQYFRYYEYFPHFYQDSSYGNISTVSSTPVPGDGILQVFAQNDIVSGIYITSWGDSITSTIPVVDTVETVELWGRKYTRWEDEWYFADFGIYWPKTIADHIEMTFKQSTAENEISAFIQTNELVETWRSDTKLAFNFKLTKSIHAAHLVFLQSVLNNPIIEDAIPYEEIYVEPN